MYTVRIPLNTPSGAPLSASPTFTDLSDYIHAKLCGARIIGEWDRAVHRAGQSIVVRTPTELPEALVHWVVGVTREFYAPLTLGAVVREREVVSELASAVAVAAGVAVASGAPRAASAVAV